MPMSHRERLETAWAFREPDRVPVELELTPRYRAHPLAERLVELADRIVDPFLSVPGARFGFFGLPAEEISETIEERPGEFTRCRHMQHTAAGDFIAITYHPAHSRDYHWEKRYISTIEDLRRLAEAERPPLTWGCGRVARGSGRHRRARLASHVPVPSARNAGAPCRHGGDVWLVP